MKKGVAIPYIIALIIGVIVVAIIGYWLISSGGTGNCVTKEGECNARIFAWCTSPDESKETTMKEVCGRSCGTGFDPKTNACPICQTISGGNPPTECR